MTTPAIQRLQTAYDELHGSPALRGEPTLDLYLAAQQVLDEATADTRVEDAITIISQFGGIDGAHHKQWVLDQVIRILHGAPKINGDTFGVNAAYVAWFEEMKGEKDADGEYEYADWDQGIAP